MADNTVGALPADDLKILRDLGEWAAQEATSARNAEKIRAWYAHDAGQADRRVMVLAETDYLQDENRPVPEHALRCTDPWARGIERGLRQRRYEVEVLRDDHVVSPFIEYTPRVHASGFGVPSGARHDDPANPLAFHYVPALRDLDEADFARLKHRTFRWNRDEEQPHRDRLQVVFAGILPVRRRTAPWHLGMPLTSTALDLVGLDQFMVLMYDNPDGLHRLMAFLRDDMLAFMAFLEENSLLDLNNEADYVGAGSMGFTRSLPAVDYDGRKVRAKDRWFLAESQESVGISPEQYGQFVFPYLKDLAQHFGRVYYGCCEPAHAILECLRTLPGLARISVSPWADEQKMGQFCRESGVAYSRKPTPNILSADRYDEAQQRDHLARTVDAAHGCRLEIIQRDVYTTRNQPQRFVRWVQLAREEGAKRRR
jgi:hypothetical protein